MFALTAGVLTWICRFSNLRVTLFTDNQTVQTMINKCTTSCKNCLTLVRLVVLECLKFNVSLFAEFVKSEDNGMADALSRGQFSRFWDLAKETMDKDVMQCQNVCGQ